MTTGAGVERWTAAAAPAGDRIAYWRDMICSVFVQLNCEALMGRPRNFHGRMTNQRGGACQFTEVVSTGQVVQRTKSLIARASDEFFLLSLQVRGTGSVVQDGRTAILHVGDMAVYDSSRPYELRFRGDFNQLVLRLPRSALAQRLVQPERMTARTIRGGAGLGRVAAAHLSQVFDALATVDPRMHDRLTGTAIDLIAAALCDQHAPDDRASLSTLATLQRILHYVEEHLADPGLDRAAVAAAHQLSPRYVTMLFEHHEAPLGAWILQRRLERCREDLLSPQFAASSITEIAFRWGFGDSSSFSRAFKARYGLSPRDLRAEPPLIS